jgi:hypothetical protein
MEQLLAHLWGDYILQSDWMANNKTSKNAAALAHCLTYGLPFLFLTYSPAALAVIVGTHFFIDRFRLAKYLVFAKNFIYPSAFNPSPEDARKYSLENCKGTGYPSETPPFMAVWLLIIADNTLHLTINYVALRYL